MNLCEVEVSVRRVDFCSDGTPWRISTGLHCVCFLRLKPFAKLAFRTTVCAALEGIVFFAFQGKSLDNSRAALSRQASPGAGVSDVNMLAVGQIKPF